MPGNRDIISTKGYLRMSPGGFKKGKLEWFVNIPENSDWKGEGNPRLTRRLVLENLQKHFGETDTGLAHPDELEKPVAGVICYMPTGYEKDDREKFLNEIEALLDM